MYIIIDVNNNITLSKILNEKDIIDYELYCYSVFNPTIIGSKNDLLLSPRIDNTTSVYASLHAFLDANSNNINVFATFNHEEIGSMTKEGAESTFLSDILRRISSSLNNLYFSLSSISKKSFSFGIELFIWSRNLTLI